MVLLALYTLGFVSALIAPTQQAQAVVIPSLITYETKSPCAAAVQQLSGGALPLIPKEIIAYPTGDISDEVDPTSGQKVPFIKETDANGVVTKRKFSLSNYCIPANWDRDVYWMIIQRAINLLNWVAGTLAIIITVYSGFLYIAGYINEGNVKKAKGLMVTAYTGLAIVFLARVILFGSVSLISGNKVDPSKPLGIQGLINLN